MPALARGPDVAAAFAELAETLASDLDIEKYLTAVCRHCVRLVDAESAAIVYAGDGVGLSEVAASDDRGRVLARGALSAAEGPWRETVRSGQLITIADLPVQGQRWPLFTAMAVPAGFTTVTLIPVGPQAHRVGGVPLLGPTQPDNARGPVPPALAHSPAASLPVKSDI